MKKSTGLSYNFSMTFDQPKLIDELQKNLDPYVVGLMCGEITGRDLFIPSTPSNFVSLIRSLIADYKIEMEDDDWYLFTVGVFRGLDLYGLDREWVVDWVVLEEDELLPEESAIILTSTNELGKKHLCVTMFEEK